MTSTRLSSFDAALDAARSLTRAERPSILGICGAPGAGKTTLARALVDALRAAPPMGMTSEWVAHLPMDGFHLADVELRALNRMDRKGAPDTFDADGYGALLRRLAQPGRTSVTYAPAFDRDIEQPIGSSIPIDPACRLIVTEGNYLLHDSPEWIQVHAAFDEVWFADVDNNVRRERLIARHVQFGKTLEQAREWVARVDDVNAATVLAEISRADHIIDVALVPFSN